MESTEFVRVCATLLSSPIVLVLRTWLACLVDSPCKIEAAGETDAGESENVHVSELQLFLPGGFACLEPFRRRRQVHPDVGCPVVSCYVNLDSSPVLLVHIVQYHITALS